MAINLRGYDGQAVASETATRITKYAANAQVVTVQQLKWRGVNKPYDGRHECQKWLAGFAD